MDTVMMLDADGCNETIHIIVVTNTAILISQ